MPINGTAKPNDQQVARLHRRPRFHAQPHAHNANGIKATIWHVKMTADRIADGGAAP